MAGVYLTNGSGAIPKQKNYTEGEEEIGNVKK
jgi:hypothetical protein